MQRILISILLIISLSFSQDWYSSIYENNKDAVVIIMNMQNNQPAAWGTGFIIEATGKIVTNYHVVEDADYIMIETIHGQRMNGEGYYYLDERNDIAILDVQANYLPTVQLHYSNKINKTDEVVAIGHPRGGGAWNTDKGNINNLQYATNGMLQQITFSANIYNGSSGGPLFNKTGEVIGITSSGIAASNHYFAIPIHYVISQKHIKTVQFSYDYLSQNKYQTQSTQTYRKKETRQVQPQKPSARKEEPKQTQPQKPSAMSQYQMDKIIKLANLTGYYAEDLVKEWFNKSLNELTYDEAIDVIDWLDDKAKAKKRKKWIKWYLILWIVWGLIPPA